MRRRHSVLRVLRDEGLLDEQALVEGVVLRDASSRNHALIVERTVGDGLFVKGGADDSPALRREAGWYRRLAGDPATAAILPDVAADLSPDGILVLVAERGATDLWEHHRRIAAFPPSIGREVGRILGILHSAASPGPGAGPGHAPAVLGIHRPRARSLADLTPAAVELIAMIQAHPAIGEALDRMREGWQASAVVHNDVKWRNLLVVPAADGDAFSIELVDWEHAETGDPSWDIGSAIAAYLASWIESIRIPGQAPASGLAAAARHPLEAMRPAIAACWSAYASTYGDERADLVAATQYAAARLILSAYESAQSTTGLVATAALQVQVAANILAAPHDAADRLLGLAPDARVRG